MTDYSDLGLDTQLNPINTPISFPRDLTQSYEFQSQNERGVVGESRIQNLSVNNAKLATAAIGTANIGTLSFNEIHGGTGIFGGTNSGSGVVSVLSQTGTEVVRLDSTGITVTNGSITIKDNLGSNVIDTNGLVSINSFVSDTVVGNGFGTTTSTNYVQVPNMTLNIVLTRSVLGLFLATVRGRVDSGAPDDSTARTALFQMELVPSTGGTVQNGAVLSLPGISVGSAGGYSINSMTSTTHSLSSVGSGTTTFRLMYKATNSSYPAFVDGSNTKITYILLGK